MKIFNKNNLVLAMACFLAIAAVASAQECNCSSDADCTIAGEVCNCPPNKEICYKSRALRKGNEQAAAARNSKRGIEAVVGSRRAKSTKSTKGSKGTACPNNSGFCFNPSDVSF